MLKRAEFQCNFCGETVKDGDTVWCKARFANGYKTNNTMFEPQWTNNPLDNTEGAHICNDCGRELAECFKIEMQIDNCPSCGEGDQVSGD